MFSVRFIFCALRRMLLIMKTCRTRRQKSGKEAQKNRSIGKYCPKSKRLNKKNEFRRNRINRREKLENFCGVCYTYIKIREKFRAEYSENKRKEGEKWHTDCSAAWDIIR